MSRTLVVSHTILCYNLYN